MITPLPQLPVGYDRVRLVGSFDELVETRFAQGVNALCWPRALEGDFVEVASRVPGDDGIVPLDEALLRALPLSAAGRRAVDVMLEDLRRLAGAGLQPSLDCIRSYPRDDDAVAPVDVYSFHADSAPTEADTYLCTYAGAPSEALRHEDALRRVAIEETRRELLQRHGGPDDETFREYVREQCHDLHYVAAPGREPFSFGVGHLWRIAIDYPGSPVPPCIHRAPRNLPGQAPRLLLIS